MRFQDYRSVLSDALKNLDTGDGMDNLKRRGIGEALVALAMVIGDIEYKIDKTNKEIEQTKDQLEKLNENLFHFNKSSSKLQVWLICWTAVIAIATVISLLT